MARWTINGWKEHTLANEVVDLAAAGDESWTVMDDSVYQLARKHRLTTRPRAIDALGPDQVWVAGDGLRLSRWDGGRWHTVPSPRINLRDEVKPKVLGDVMVDDLCVLGPHDVWMSATVTAHSFGAIWTNAPMGSAPHEDPAPSPATPTPAPSPSLVPQDERPGG
ncbi:hypothetical protein [Nonomuraea rhodomycinica]|uniref:Uncharacterized protein n=1 Tax=Nonomuraea rhodomycinica TaxID=1712872 RepID=A0A7Y6MHD8_9ACTN|nr:hypothetical protein [Nonomuraea rhodomycinica]NUW46879.1 hypothetical protein [Nonomuraea rhodomycinica]